MIFPAKLKVGQEGNIYVKVQVSLDTEITGIITNPLLLKDFDYSYLESCKIRSDEFVKHMEEIEKLDELANLVRAGYRYLQKEDEKE